MKNIFFFLFACSLSVSLGYGQPQTVWTDPINITDSLADNTNVSMLEQMDYYTDSIYSVWERAVDASSTALYGRNLMTMSEPFVILSQPNVRFRNPRVFSWISGDTVLIVLYETNMNGNWDIYSSKVLKDGSVAPPVAVCNSSASEKNYKYVFGPGIVWEQNGAIMIKKYSIGGNPSIAPPVTLDQGNCYNPALSSDFCAWEKVIGNDTVIMYSVYDYGSSVWGTPSQFVDGVNSELSCGETQNAFMVWQARENTYWRVKCADVSSHTFYSIPDFPGTNNVDPTFTFVPIITKVGFPFQDAFFAFASRVGSNYEIFVNQDFWDTTFINISNHATNDFHPQFFSTWSYMYGSLTVFLCWESWRNNHWQIWMSHIDVPEGINEHGSDRSASLQNYPNPFNRSTTIDYELKNGGPSEIAIFTMMGKEIRILKNGADIPGKHSLVWDAKDDNGNRVSPGIYLCSLKINDRVIQRKLTVFQD
jgi:hypothetical protein